LFLGHQPRRHQAVCAARSRVGLRRWPRGRRDATLLRRRIGALASDCEMESAGVSLSAGLCNKRLRTRVLNAKWALHG
jgi:hypothetical protein